MPDYAAFGGLLRSELVFPELREHGGAAVDWTLRTTPAAPELNDAELLGDLDITPSCRVRMFRHARGGGFRLAFDDTGTYDVSGDGRQIVWFPGPDAAADVVRSDIMGRVLATALHAGDVLCLHASGVALRGGAVALLAPKYHGKSTLAMALVRAGGRLITDDVLPVAVDSPPRAIPGLHQVKLWEDSAVATGVAGRGVNGGEKHLAHDFPNDMLMFERAPLAAIYLLAPATGHTGSAVACTRCRVADTLATLALVRHATLGPLMGGSQAPVLLHWAASLARRVPVFRLDVAPGLERLPEVVAQLFEWHDHDPGNPRGAAR